MKEPRALPNTIIHDQYATQTSKDAMNEIEAKGVELGDLVEHVLERLWQLEAALAARESSDE